MVNNKQTGCTLQRAKNTKTKTKYVEYLVSKWVPACQMGIKIDKEKKKDPGKLAQLVVHKNHKLAAKQYQARIIDKASKIPFTGERSIRSRIPTSSNSLKNLQKVNTIKTKRKGRLPQRQIQGLPRTIGSVLLFHHAFAVAHVNMRIPWQAKKITRLPVEKRDLKSELFIALCTGKTYISQFCCDAALKLMLKTSGKYLTFHQWDSMGVYLGVLMYLSQMWSKSYCKTKVCCKPIHVENRQATLYAKCRNSLRHGYQSDIGKYCGPGMRGDQASGRLCLLGSNLVEKNLVRLDLCLKCVATCWTTVIKSLPADAIFWLHFCLRSALSACSFNCTPCKNLTCSDYNKLSRGGIFGSFSEHMAMNAMRSMHSHQTVSVLPCLGLFPQVHLTAACWAARHTTSCCWWHSELCPEIHESTYKHILSHLQVLDATSDTVDTLTL